MKRTLSIIICILISFGVVACSAGISASTAGTPAPTQAVPTTEAIPTEAVPTEVIPSDAAPTEAVPTDIIPSDAVPTEAASTDEAQLPYEALLLADKIRNTVSPDSSFESNEPYERENYSDRNEQWFEWYVTGNGYRNISIICLDGKVAGGSLNYCDYTDDEAVTTQAMFDAAGDFFIFSKYTDERNIVIDPELTPLPGHTEEHVFSRDRDIRSVVTALGAYTHSEAEAMDNCTKEWVLEESEWYRLVYEQDVINDENSHQIKSILKVVEPSKTDSDFEYRYFITVNTYGLYHYGDNNTCEYQQFACDEYSPYHSEAIYDFHDEDRNRLFTFEEEYGHSDGYSYIDRLELFDSEGQSIVVSDAVGHITGLDTSAIIAELAHDGYVGASRKYCKTYQITPTVCVTGDYTYTRARDDYDIDDIVLVDISFSVNGEQFYSTVLGSVTTLTVTAP